jgi:hypothetical protein
MTDLKKQTDAAMKVLSDLSASAKMAGDGDLMSAANRAWVELYNHQTVTLKEAVVKASRSWPTTESENPMSEIRQMTVAELAEDAFLKQEYLQAQMMMNTPTDFEERKKAFVRLAMAREAANNAQRALDAAVARSWPKIEDEMIEWQPMETAPKDGTEILVWMDGKQIIVARWAEALAFGWADWIETVEGYRLRKNLLTHWMPLPASPRTWAGREHAKGHCDTDFVRPDRGHDRSHALVR